MHHDEIQKLKKILAEDSNDDANISNVLKEIFKKQKNIIMTICVLELIYESVYLYDIILKRNGVLKFMKSLNDDLYDTIESFRDVVGRIRYYKQIDLKIRENIIKMLEDKKENLESDLEVLYGYFVEARYCSDVFNDKLKTFNHDNFDVSIEEFYNNIKEFVFENEEEKFERIQEVISSIPFALSRKRFFDYMKSGLIHEYNGYDKLIQNIFEIEENFYGKLVEGYGEKFTEIANKIEELQTIDLKNATKDDLELYLKETIVLLGKIHDIREIVYSLIRIVNRLLIFYKSDRKIEDTLQEEPKIKIFLDVYGSIYSEKYTKKKVKDFLRTLNEYISNWYFELYNYNRLLNDMNYLENDIENLIDEDILNDIEILAEYENLMNDDGDDFDDMQGDAIEGSIVEEEINNLISMIDDISRNMNPDYRKVRMRRLLGIIPVPGNFENEFFNYLKSSLEFDTTSNVKAAIIESVDKRIKLYKDMKNSKHLYEALLKNVKEGL
ncbi:hypothetical protein [Thermoanaerobacterium thermosaccharolyticum]|uniref:hypothetical protein n=1 Tax=Thermoanaerobacterium thermosaccharolyticum TaxID=1517 RepID=UPI003DA98061